MVDSEFVLVRPDAGDVDLEEGYKADILLDPDRHLLFFLLSL